MLHLDLDVIVVNTSRYSVEDDVQRYLSTVTVSGVYHCKATEEEQERNQVSARDWLLYNVATAPFIVETSHDNYRKILPSVWVRVAQTIDRFRAQFEPASDDPNAPGRVQLVFEGLGINSLWANVHNRTRLLRNFSATFAGLPRIAYLVPMSLRGLSTVPILTTLAPSLRATCSHLRFTRGLYIGVDASEVNSIPLEHIRRHFETTLDVNFERLVRFPDDWRYERSMAKMYNELFRRAMIDGYDFAVQLQDDARLNSPSWELRLCSVLCANSLGIGACSLQDRKSPARFNNVIVSRTHFDIFGFLFNPEAADTSQWLASVLGLSLAKIDHRCMVTNMLQRTKRRSIATRVNTSDQAQLVAADKALFQRASGSAFITGLERTHKRDQSK